MPPFDPYCGPAPLPKDVWTTWNTDPVVIATLLAAAAAVAFIKGSRLAWLGAVFVLALAFISPLCALASALFSARVLHHVLIVAVAAPLLVVGARLRAAHDGPAFLAHLGAIWLWHMPQPYAAALGSDALYWLMEVSLLGTGVWLWAAMLAPGRGGRGIVLSLATLVQMGLLGALLTFASRPLFAAHLGTTQAFGLTPLEDQQLAGLLMWAPAALPYIGFALHSLFANIFPQREAA